MKGGKQSQELSLLIQQVFESSVLTELSPRSQIDIYIQVLQSDGGKNNMSMEIDSLTFFDIISYSYKW
jgi:exosome complex component RRP41